MKKKRRSDGQTIVEYVLVLGLFSIVLLTAVTFYIRLGNRVTFNKYKNVLKGPYEY